jgi:hypothetical protein
MTVNSHERTNIIVLSIPHRPDLVPNLCVNYELKVFKSKLGRQRKVHKNVSVITVDLYRNLCTGHGFHLSSKGKQQTANRIAFARKGLFPVNKVMPVALKWKAKKHRLSIPNANKQMLGVQEVKASGCENKVLSQTYGNSKSSDHKKVMTSIS